MKSKCSFAAWLISFSIGIHGLEATTYTWNGNSLSSNNWSDSANWLNGSIPPSGTATDVVFSSAGANTASVPNSLQDLPPSPFLVNTMTFSFAGTDAFTLSGGNLAFTQSKILTQSSAAPVTIANALSVNGLSGGSFDLTAAGDGSGLLTLSGGVNTGSSPFRKQGTSTIAFTATSQFYSMTVEGGTVRNSGQQSLSRPSTIASTTAVAAHYELLAGTLSANNGVTIGGTGPGIFDQSGGGSGALTVAAGGTYNLSAGSVSSSLTVKAGGTFVQTGGGCNPSFFTLESGGSFSTSGGSMSAMATIGTAAGPPAVFTVINSGAPTLFNLSLNATSSLTVRDGGTATAPNGNSQAGSTVFISNPSAGVSALTVGTSSGPHSSTFAGVIADAPAGPGGITCLGTGQTVFQALNTYTGSTRVSTGLIAGNGGIAGPLSLTSGATISPGNFTQVSPDATDAGFFQIGSLTMAAGTKFKVEINGSAAGQFDVLAVHGVADLSAGPTLTLASAYNGAPGQPLIIMSVDGGAENPISGQFVNAPNGSVISAGGRMFSVNYQGGNGNDLTLTALDPAAAARKMHGTFGPFDVGLPLTGTPAVECRSGGADRNFTIVFSFLNPLASVGAGQITSGVGTISSQGIGTNPREYVVNLTGVGNLQRLTVALTNVTDSTGSTVSSISATMRVLLGDASNDGMVNSGDAVQTRNSAGQSLDVTNFRSDVNADGSINSGDVFIVRSKSGNSVAAADREPE